jgi:hypothetical protein
MVAARRLYSHLMSIITLPGLLEQTSDETAWTGGGKTPGRVNVQSLAFMSTL